MRILLAAIMFCPFVGHAETVVQPACAEHATAHLTTKNPDTHSKYEFVFSLLLPHADAAGGCSCPDRPQTPDHGCFAACSGDETPSCTCGIGQAVSFCYCS